MSTATVAPASPTPILDRLEPMPAPEKRRSQIVAVLIWWGLVFAVVLAYQFWHPRVADVVMYWAGQIMQGTDTGDTAVWGVLLRLGSFVLAFFLAIAVHEGGHALVGVCVGFRFNSLRVGPVQFDRGFRISFYRGRKTGAGGWASLFPVKHDKLRERAIVMLLAGPAVNLLTVALLVWAPWSKGMFSAQFIYMSLLLGVVNLIPFRSRAVFSDGGRISMLLENRARGERWLAMIKLLDEMQRGVAPQEMTKEFLAKAVALEDKSPDTISAHAIAHSVAFWSRNDEEAARTLEVCLRHAAMAAPIQRQGLANLAVVFQARRRKRIDLAEQWQVELPEKLELPWTRAWGQAAILEGKGDIAGTRAKLDEIEAMAGKWPNEFVRNSLLRSLGLWRGELASS